MAWEKTEEIAKILKARIIIFQCPPNFEPTTENKKNLKIFFSVIKRKDYIFAWEPRGKWTEKEIGPLCRELDLIHTVDPFKSMPTYGRIRYFRLHGIGGYRYKYTREDLIRLKGILKEEKDFYIMFNNVYMYEDALAFHGLMFKPSL